MKKEDFSVNIKSISTNLLNLIRSDIFLKGTHANNNEELIHNADEAVCYSTDQDAQDKYPGIQYWSSILEYNNDLLKISDLTLEYSFRDNIEREIKESNEKITSALILQFTHNALPNEILGVISENFNVFLNEMAYFGKLSSFQNILLQAYKRGFFPCGWRGNFPSGKLIVFSRKS